ncbi:uncharacterized protein C8R40DRAFT_1167761 [Lentinula edodes]|uniref:uncharacterized protein n=1 Tax=Lentinula edodes TaxID=5353 RepID=UPI001E8DB6F5|nr:uncharacterized protein C8R40DRAFT_1167761 [Lentinula edodes]KAH7878336.1 hypothetical protein C8R40DRAFT_1167761 [Lentinula edodes]
MFASIFAPETLAGYWIVQNSDAEFPGDETDDEDDLPYLDLSEVHKVQASSSYPSVDTRKIAMPLTSPTPKPTTQPHGIPRRALSSVFAGPPKSSFLKDIKFRKKPSCSTTPIAIAQYADPGSSCESLSTSSASYPSVSVPTSFSEPISTQSWSSSSLSAQSLRKSYSQPEPLKFVECHSLPVKAQQFSIQPGARLLNPPGLSEEALGKRKALNDRVKPHVKRGGPAKPRPSTVLANSSTSRYQSHVSHTHHDAYHAQNLYEARDDHLIPGCIGQRGFSSRTSAVSASGPSTRFGGPQVSNDLVKIPSSQGNQNGHIHQFYSPHAHVQTSTQTNAHIPGLTSPPPIAVVGSAFLGDGAELGTRIVMAAEKFSVLLQNDPQQAKDVIEMLQLQRPGQTIATCNTLPQPQLNGSLDGFLNMPRRDPGIGHEITNRNSSVHGDHRGVDVGEWLIPSLGTGRIPEAGDQVNSGIEPGLYSGLSRNSRAEIEISTPDHPAIQFGQQKHTSMPPDADILDSSERVFYSSDPLPHRGKQRMISVQLKARTRRNTDPQSSATSPVPQPPPPVLQSNAVSALSATPATLASPSTVSSSLQKLKATLNNGVDVIVISIESGSGLQANAVRRRD